MASRRNSRAKYPHKCVVSNQESPAIEQHLMQLGAHHFMEIQDEPCQAGCATQCFLGTQFSTEEERPKNRARAGNRPPL
jgi:hypothetical protein